MHTVSRSKRSHTFDVKLVLHRQHECMYTFITTKYLLRCNLRENMRASERNKDVNATIIEILFINNITHITNITFHVLHITNETT